MTYQFDASQFIEDGAAVRAAEARRARRTAHIYEIYHRNEVGKSDERPIERAA